MKKTFDIKPDVDIEDLMFLQPATLYLLGAFVVYANNLGLPVNITSICEDVQGRKTRTHCEGRAFDVSVRGWNLLDIQNAVAYFNKNFKDIGAISSSDHKARALVYHKIPGGIAHFHAQTRLFPEGKAVPMLKQNVKCNQND